MSVTETPSRSQWNSGKNLGKTIHKLKNIRESPKLSKVVKIQYSPLKCLSAHLRQTNRTHQSILTENQITNICIDFHWVHEKSENTVRAPVRGHWIRGVQGGILPSKETFTGKNQMIIGLQVVIGHEKHKCSIFINESGGWKYQQHNGCTVKTLAGFQSPAYYAEPRQLCSGKSPQPVVRQPLRLASPA